MQTTDCTGSTDLISYMHHRLRMSRLQADGKKHRPRHPLFTIGLLQSFSSYNIPDSAASFCILKPAGFLQNRTT